MNTKDALENYDLGVTAKVRNRAPRTEYLGDLHKLLTKGLPDLVDVSGTLDTRRLASEMNISYQALYKWFEREQVPSKRLHKLIDISKRQKTGGDLFKPLTRDDLWKFLAR